MRVTKFDIYRIFVVILLFCSVTDGFGQGQITRPSKSNSHNKPPKRTQTQQSDNQNQHYLDSIANLPREEEYINNLLVRWSPDVTNEQKTAITTIVNNLIDIEGGTFIMGSDKHDHYWEYAGKRYYIDEPTHSERVNSFKLSKYELTQRYGKQLWEIIPLDIGEMIFR